VGFWILVYSTDIFGISAVVAVTIKDYFKHCKNFSVQYR